MKIGAMTYQARAPKPPQRDLNERQRLFIEEYLKDYNAAGAYVRAGYAKKGAKQSAYQLLTNPHIEQALAQAHKRREARIAITSDDVIRELAICGFSNLSKMFENGELKSLEDVPEDVQRSIAGIEVVTRKAGEGEVEHVAKIKPWDKVGSLIALGRHFGLFQDKLDIKAQVDIHAQRKQLEDQVANMTDAELAQAKELTERAVALLKTAGARG